MKRAEIFPLESSQKYQFSDILGIKNLPGKVSSFVMYPIKYTKIVLIIGKTIIKTKKICSYISVLELEFWSIYFGFWTYCFISFKLQNAFCRIRRLAALGVLFIRSFIFFGVLFYWDLVVLGVLLHRAFSWTVRFFFAFCCSWCLVDWPFCYLAFYLFTGLRTQPCLE